MVTNDMTASSDMTHVASHQHGWHWRLFVSAASLFDLLLLLSAVWDNNKKEEEEAVSQCNNQDVSVCHAVLPMQWVASWLVSEQTVVQLEWQQRKLWMPSLVTGGAINPYNEMYQGVVRACVWGCCVGVEDTW